MHYTNKIRCVAAISSGMLIINFVLMFVNVIPDWWYSGYWNLISTETSRLMNLWLTGVCLASIAIVSLYYYLLYGRHDDE